MSTDDDFALPEEPDDSATEDATEEEALTPQEEMLAFDILEVGHQTFEKVIYGHKVLIKTPTIGEEMEALVLIKEYRDTEAVLKAWKVATVAAVIQEIDGAPVFVPIKNSDLPIRKRYDAMKEYHESFIDAVYEFYNDSMQDIRKVIDKLGKSSG